MIALKAGEIVFDGLPPEIDEDRFREIYGEDAVEVEIGPGDAVPEGAAPGNADNPASAPGRYPARRASPLARLQSSCPHRLADRRSLAAHAYGWRVTQVDFVDADR